MKIPLTIEITRGTCNARLPRGTLIQTPSLQADVVVDTDGDYSILFDAAGELHIFVGTPRTVADWNHLINEGRCPMNCGIAVGVVLDDMIEHWREKVREGSPGGPVAAACYVDALQSARKNSLGEEKP